MRLRPATGVAAQEEQSNEELRESWPIRIPPLAPSTSTWITPDIRATCPGPTARSPTGSVSSQPTFSYYESLSGEEKRTLPVGVGVAKTTRIGKTPWKFSLQYWHFVKQADSLGPDFQIRFSLGLVVPLPW